MFPGASDGSFLDRVHMYHGKPSDMGVSMCVCECVCGISSSAWVEFLTGITVTVVRLCKHRYIYVCTHFSVILALFPVN